MQGRAGGQPVGHANRQVAQGLRAARSLEAHGAGRSMPAETECFSARHQDSNAIGLTTAIAVDHTRWTPCRPLTTSAIFGGIATSTRDFFAAHEAWEDVWREADPAERRFDQGLIHAAVAVYHASNGNAGGARRLYRSGRTYMSAYPDPTAACELRRFGRP